MTDLWGQHVLEALADVDLSDPVDWSHPLADGLVGLWIPIPSLIGGNALYDLSRQKRHGRLYNMNARTDWVNTERGVSLDFDGSTTYVRINDSYDVGGGSFSVVAWIYRRYGYERKYVSKWSHNDPYQLFQFDCQVYNDYKLWFQVQEENGDIYNTGQIARGTTYINANQWYHVANVANTENKSLKIYLDAKEEPLQYAPTWNGTVQSQKMPMDIGRKFGEVHYWDGMITDVRIYRKALTEEQVSRIYEDSLSLRYSFLRRRKIWYPSAAVPKKPMVIVRRRRRM